MPMTGERIGWQRGKQAEQPAPHRPVLTKVGEKSMDQKDINVRRGAPILDAFVDSLDWSQLLELTGQWTQTRQSRYMCFCNVHSVVSAKFLGDAGRAIRGADLALPDGMPVAWALRMMGFRNQRRIDGPTFMWRLCSDLQERSSSIFLYGNRQSTLDTLCVTLKQAFPRLQIAGVVSPPYRQLTPDEDDAMVNAINASGASVVLVGLGCPKQEMWMARHRGRIRALLVGVGAAFDYHAGTVTRAKPWMQASGLEWLYRLIQEPRRLWKRYLVTNALFVVCLAAQFIGQALPGNARAHAAPSSANLSHEGEL
jgi:N-acetylglucosaminyldiphosphoundecaprenol N-acetyl-beta-D-mannosaminyltransferase